MNLGEFHTLVKDELNRGSSLDAHIPGTVRRAVKFLEKNHSFQHMQEETELTLNKDSHIVELVNILPDNLKSIRYVQLQNVTDYFGYGEGEYGEGGFGGLAYIPGLICNVPLRGPTDAFNCGVYGVRGVWRVKDELRFPFYACEDLACILGYYKYTPWPTEEDGEDWLETENWWTTEGENLLLYQTMVFLANRMRQPGIKTLYQADLDRELKVTLDADEEGAENAQDSVMSYGAGPV